MKLKRREVNVVVPIRIIHSWIYLLIFFLLSAIYIAKILTDGMFDQRPTFVAIVKNWSMVVPLLLVITILIEELIGFVGGKIMSSIMRAIEKIKEEREKRQELKLIAERQKEARIRAEVYDDLVKKGYDIKDADREFDDTRRDAPNSTKED